MAIAHGNFYAARSRALAAFNPRRGGSLVFQALRDRFARFVPPLNYDENTLTPDAAEELHQNLSEAIATGRVRPEQLDDEDVLRTLAQEEVGRFIGERQSAREAVESISFPSGAAKHAVLAQVSRDNIPAGLVSRAVESGLLIREDLERLASAPETEDVADLVDNLRLVMVTAWREPDMDVSETNEELVYRWLWRIVLASRSEAEARAILQGMAQEHSPLRCVCEAAAWYAEEFQESEQHIRAARPVGDDRSFKPTANDVAKVLCGLWVTLQERTGWEVDAGRPPAKDERPHDLTIAALRNLGIPFPAPDRLGESNAAVPLADTTLEEIGEAFVRHVRSNAQGASVRDWPAIAWIFFAFNRERRGLAG